MRIAAALPIMVLAACAGPRELLSLQVSDEQTMKQMAAAAEGCGFEAVRLERVYAAMSDKDTRMRMRLPAARRNDYGPGNCLNDWLTAHPEIDYEIIVRSE